MSNCWHRKASLIYQTSAAEKNAAQEESGSIKARKAFLQDSSGEKRVIDCGEEVSGAERAKVRSEECIFDEQSCLLVQSCFD